MNRTKRLKLPGGGSFELPMLNGAALDDLGVVASDSWSTLPTVAAGAALGGLLTWLLLRLQRS